MLRTHCCQEVACLHCASMGNVHSMMYGNTYQVHNSTPSSQSIHSKCHSTPHRCFSPCPCMTTRINRNSLTTGNRPTVFNCATSSNCASKTESLAACVAANPTLKSAPATWWASSNLASPTMPKVWRHTNHIACLQAQPTLHEFPACNQDQAVNPPACHHLLLHGIPFHPPAMYPDNCQKSFKPALQLELNIATSTTSSSRNTRQALASVAT